MCLLNIYGYMGYPGVTLYPGHEKDIFLKQMWWKIKHESHHPDASKKARLDDSIYRSLVI